MAKILDVYFHEKLIGQLKQTDRGDLSFTYRANWLNDAKATRISCSLPLQQGSFKRSDCHAFFGGILPEENQRKIIAKNLGISAKNDFSMLEKIGGECAGALSFIAHGETLNPQNRDYHELTDSALSNILKELPSKPLLAGEQGIRLSLAGVQDKLALYVEEEKFFIPLNNAPSTHILKPNFGVYHDVIFNEAFCLDLAKQAGLPVAESTLKKTGDIDYLLIKRYDRAFQSAESSSKKIMRVHQEDFCQALGISSENKYQNEGGPSLKKCFSLIRAESSTPVIDLEKMINAIIFNYLIGNCDAHGKNFSLLYLDRLQLAPLYDLVCTLYYKNLSQKMAMKLGGEYQINVIGVKHFDALAEEIDFSKPQLHKRILELIDALISSLPALEIHHPIQEEIGALIKTRCVSFSKRLKKGK